ncbi:MAG: hypothetical protein Q8R28_15060 [Dehalococcoidia bacterium]|nr:hypothetical protein [Dehalococcoidia bacterium]
MEWNEDGFDSEAQLVEAIRGRLLTEEQRGKLYDWNLSIEDLLNGRVEGNDQDMKYAYFFDAWNAAIGRKVFGF